MRDVNADRPLSDALGDVVSGDAHPVCVADAWSCSAGNLYHCLLDGSANQLIAACGPDLCDAVAKTCRTTCTDIALMATASSSGGGVGNVGPASMNNGLLSCDFHWISNDSVNPGSWIELDWATPQTVAMFHMDTVSATLAQCMNVSGRTVARGEVQWWNGTGWVSGGLFSGMTDDFDFAIAGGPVTTTKLRIWNLLATTSGYAHNSVIYEWFVYPSVGCPSPPDP
jgi:hypothetical protein